MMMRIECGSFRCKGTRETISVDRLLSVEQVDVLVAIIESVGQTIHTTSAVEFDPEGSVAVVWLHKPSLSLYTTTLIPRAGGGLQSDAPVLVEHFGAGEPT